ncbi:ABC transporter substrate-binding protein [Telmatospirillum sp. J64-1]|uniref:ABC transporter substrate-binding protein n=1 Tax=Telmatospirillum sp. J64-1 TaxID=2502183 RepID=UPI001C8F40FC|nr:ABC transporter substrate-binding protein [Telmatospirillum sp. J64-1]
MVPWLKGFRRNSLAMAVGAIFLASPAWAETVTDIAGRTIETPAKVERIVVGMGALLPAVLAAEGDLGFSRIVAIGGDFTSREQKTYERFVARYPEVAQIPALRLGQNGEGLGPDEVLALKPDVAIMPGGPRPGSLGDSLEKAGVTVVYVDFRQHPGQNTIPSVRAIGKALGREAQAAEFISFYEENLRKVTDITATLPEDQKPRVFLDMRPPALECCGTPGKGNFGDFLTAAGAVNIGALLQEEPLGRVEPQQIAEQNPDIYIAGSGGQGGALLGLGVTAEEARESLRAMVQTREGVNTLKAVKDGEIFSIWHPFYNNAFNVVAIQAFAKRFHPDLFADLEPEKTLEVAYTRFLGISPEGVYWADGRD